MDYAARRARLAAQMQPGSVAVLFTAPEVLRNGDSDYPYRHDSHFYYLTGFTEPESALVLVAAHDDKPAKAILFCREKNVEREIWDGYRHGPEAARTAFGVDDAYPVGELDTHMARILANAPALYYPLASSAAFDARVTGWIKAVRAQGRTGTTAPDTFVNVLPLLDEMRLVKDADEQAVMLRAGEISGGAHARAMRAARAGMFEYELEAELLYEFRRNGAQFPAYTPIVASGPNACVLHYNVNDRQMQDGDLVLIDAGCELDGYASDITRTFPVNGRYSKEQRAIYQLLLDAQHAALAEARAGRPYDAGHNAAVATLTEGLLKLGLLKGTLEKSLASADYKRFYMHKTGHWIGLDVHDVGEYRIDGAFRELEPGMVFTIEPGLYIAPGSKGVAAKWQGIGVRIEDDVLITRDGCEVLTSGVPKEIDEVEALLASR